MVTSVAGGVSAVGASVTVATVVGLVVDVAALDMVDGLAELQAASSSAEVATAKVKAVVRMPCPSGSVRHGCAAVARNCTPGKRTAHP